MTGYDTAIADLARDRERILGLWRSGLTHHGKPDAKFDWYYLRNPEGPPTVVFLVPDGGGEAVGVASVAARRMRLGDTDIESGWLADFVVDEAHRSFFPALALQRAMQREGLARHPVLIGMPNAKSEAVVLRCGSRRVGDVVRRVRVLRSGNYLARHVPAAIASVAGAVIDFARRVVSPASSAGEFHAEWLEAPDERFDDLWRRAAPRGLVAGVRDARFLAWRFSQCPLQEYRFLALSEGPLGRLVAYAACTSENNSLEVADFVVDGGHPGAAARLWDAVAEAGWREGFASASVEFLGPNAMHQQLETAGWVQRSRRAFIGAMPGRPELLSPERWFMTPADEDG